MLTLFAGMAALALPLQVLASDSLSEIGGTVRRAGARQPIAAAEVRLDGTALRAVTNTAGAFTIRGVAAGTWRVRVSARAFQPYEVIVRVGPRTTVRLDVELDARPQDLPRVEVAGALDAADDIGRARELADAVLLPAVTTISRRELQRLPTIVEPDVLRALQSLPGGVLLNEFDAQLYVRGGAPDQNIVLLDGARVFGAYHMFGMAGVFNTDAVERVDFFRGGGPSRVGGALSSVTEIELRDGTRDAPIEAGISMVGARAMVRGATETGDHRWMLSGRRSHADLAMDDAIPYAFHDAQGRYRLKRDGAGEFTVSGLLTGDRFRVGFDESKAVRSGSRNRMGSIRWSGRGAASASRVTLWGSDYTAHIDAGEDLATRVNDAVRAGGLRLEQSRAVRAAVLNVGAELEAGEVTLLGSRAPGGFLEGDTRARYSAPALFADLDLSIGRVRLAPGLRMTHLADRHATLIHPRLGARVELAPRTSLTLSAGRSHQWLSTLRDERMVLPGAELWILHPRHAPVSRADDVALELTQWTAGDWMLSGGAYMRRFLDRPVWMPASVRDLTSLRWDDGRSQGLELSARRFGQRVSGWAGYSLSRTHFRDATTGGAYDPRWDRRHSFNSALLWRAATRLHLSAEARYGSGHPSWPFLGEGLTPKLEPFEGGINSTYIGPLWSNTQVRHEPWLRLDVGARTAFGLRGAIVEPYLNLQNITWRANVLYYQLRQDPPGFRPEIFPRFFLPTLGFNVRF